MAKELALPVDIAALEFVMAREDVESLSEKEILERVRLGDKEAYRHIVTRYMTRAYSIALGYVHNHQDALDLSQDCFVKIFRKLKRYDPRRPFFPWMYEVLKNLCLDHLRRRKRRPEVPLEGLRIAGPNGEDRDLKAVVWRGIDSLSPDHKEIILLRYFQEYSYKEIAELTGKPVGTVMSSLFYAKAKLREIMKGYLGRGAARNRESS
jgi:RNA polymerase sigma-70 factor (ECF subfamily)